jgi:zinc and cadmium transporter
MVSILIPYATGTLLTTALFGLIPEAIGKMGNDIQIVMFVILIAIIFFFFLEKLIIWRNCADEDCEVHSAGGPIVLIGDAFHNFIDGIVIASAFLTNFSVGLSASLAILFHEIPQETGDFGILIHSGYSRKKAFKYNALSSAATIPSAIASFFLLGSISIIVPYALAISAASFLYIALSDLTPELHQKWGFKQTIRQLALIFFGVMTMMLIISLLK